MKHDKLVQELLDKIGKNVRMHRKAKKMTLRQISKETGITISNLSFIERGKMDCDILSLLHIADCLNMGLKELF